MCLIKFSYADERVGGREAPDRNIRFVMQITSYPCGSSQPSSTKRPKQFAVEVGDADRMPDSILCGELYKKGNTMHMSGKARLFAGTAGAVCAIVLVNSPAGAQCVVNASTVTCAGTTPASTVNTAISTVPGSTVTVRIQPDAVITRNVPSVQATNPPFAGAVDIANAGTLGATGATVGLNYFGQNDGAVANIVTLANSGTITGQVFVSGVGGTIGATNTGTLSGGLSLSGNGDVTLTSSGPIYVATGGAGPTAVNLTSFRQTQATTGTSGVDGLTTTTTTGGTTSATLTGPVAVPAAGTAAAVPQAINIFGVGGARLTLNAVAGAVTVSSNGTNQTFVPGGSNNSTSGGTTTTTSSNSQTAVGGASSAALGTESRVASLAVFADRGAGSATIAGQVGSADALGAVNVSAVATNSTSSSRTINDATSSSSQFSNTSTPIGGAASVDLATTGRVFGAVSANSNGGAATATIAGTVGAGSGTAVTTLGNVNATSQGTSVASTSSSTNRFATGDFTSVSQTTRAATGKAANVTVASTGAVFGSATANGDASAAVDNAGRIRDGVAVFSARSIQTASQSANSQVTTAGTGGASTVISTTTNGATNTTIGGTAAFQNRAGAVVEDNVNVSGVGGGSVTNAGAIFGNVALSSAGTTSTSANSFTSTATTTPATGGGATTRIEQVSANSSSTAPNGGSVTGDYSGTVGAVAGSTLAGYRTVTQNGQAGSTATIGGTLFADFSSTAGGAANISSSGSTTVQTNQPAVAPATAAQEFTSVSTSRNSNTQAVANNAVTVTGALRNNGTGTGDLSVSTSSGASTLTINGGILDGGVAVSAGGLNTSSGTDSSSRSTTAATAAGPFAPTIAQSAISSNFSETRGAAGTSSVTLTKAQIGGGVAVSGRGAGAGSTAAALNVSADTVIGGDIDMFVNTQPNSRTENTTTDTRTASNAVNRVVRSSTVQTAPTQVGGNTVLALAGKAGNTSVYSSYGNASATLTGQVAGGIDVSTGLTLFNSTSEQTYSGTSTTGFTFPTQTGSTQSSSSTNVGGTASLAIASSPALQTLGTSAVSGDIYVSGFGGSTLTNAAGSRLIGSNGGSIYVGTSVQDATNTFTNTYATGVLTGQTSTSTSRQVGGAAGFTNAGIIGASTGYFGAPVGITVQSIGGATVANTGTIYGSILAVAGGLDTTSTSTSTGLNDAVITRTATTTTNTARGGAVALTNAGIVSGGVTVAGATGTVTNTGVMRGGLTLGQAVAAYTTQDVATATSTTTVATAASPRATQVYTANQNGLLIGGIQVADPTVADPTTGAATTARLRTTDVAATVNLTGSSITLGNVVGAVSTEGTRLTNTTVNLTGNGFLGAGTNDTPSAALGTGSGTLRYVNTPGYGSFIAIDPALGSLAGTVFTPSVSLASGSRITGVTLVEKSGAGSFTIVGAPFLATSNANPQARYTMDVGTFRVSGGEVQLGVAGSDPTTGASLFGIRGNVENTGGTLVLGRRVTDGATTVLQGTSVRIDGNLTQAGTGTIALAATPALVRSNGTVVGALPAQGILGFGGYGVGLTPFVAYDPISTASLRSTPSTLTVNGNVSLAGTVALATTPGAIYTAGRNMDLITVSGTFAQSNLTLAPGFSSPFVKFALTPRASGTATIVSLDVQRTPYASVTTTTNAASAAGALDAALPNVVASLATIRNPNGVADVQGYGRLQDLATIISGLDTQLSASDASRAFVELGSGSVYGSLAAVSTTAPFGEAVDSVGSTNAGLGLWARPTGRLARFDGEGRTGASRFKAYDFGGAMGINVTTDSGGNFGVGGGYGRVNARDRDLPSQAHANTYMIGAYAAQKIDLLSLSAQVVFGWSNWDTTRSLPLFARTATASFDSKEFRFDARVGYDFLFGNAVVTPFAKADVRRYSFDAFDEQDAGGIGLAVGKRDKTVFSPELGLRLSGNFSTVRPFLEGGYVFQGDIDGYRTVSFLGDRANSFRLEGVEPDGYGKLAAGVQADVYGASLFLRAGYLTGGGNSTSELAGGISLRF